MKLNFYMKQMIIFLRIVNSNIYIYKNRFYLDLDDEYIKICEYVDDIIYKDNKLINNN